MDDSSNSSTGYEPSTPIMTPTTSRRRDSSHQESTPDGSKSPLIFVNNVSLHLEDGQESDAPRSYRSQRSPSPFEQTIGFQVGSKKGSQEFTFKQLFNTTPNRRGRPKDSHASSTTPDSESDDILSLPMKNLRLKGLKVDDEVLPSEPYYNKGFQISLRDGVEIAKAVVKCLENTTDARKPDSGLGGILQSALELSHFDAPATRTIGVVGDSAAGKSSLINSLLDKPDLAHTGDQGSAVTSFVTEYRYKSNEQTTDFTVEAEYLKLEEINEYLEELLWSYRQPFAPNLKDDVTAEEFKTLETESCVAWDTLHAAFGNRKDFSAERLKDFSDGAFDSILASLCSWASSLEWPSGAEGGRWRQAADTVEDCYELTDKFMQDRLWPFTKIMRIYLQAPVLKTGLVLADLPGYRDINFARVKAARQYQANCDELFIVANINRAVTDKSVKTIIADYLGSGAKNAGPITHPNITLVCTHSADIDVKKAAKTYKTVREEDLKHAQRQIKKTKEQKYRDHEQALTNYKYLFVAARNGHVTQQLQQAYSEEFHPHKLPVFCVDNKDYQDRVFSLEVTSTGIPQLRHFCYSVPAKALFRSAHNFLENLLPSLIQSVQLWYQTHGSESRSKSIAELIIVDNLRTDLYSLVDEWKTEFFDRSYEQVLDPLRKEKQQFNDAALRASNRWAGWNWASYKAYCRKNGTYSTQAQPSQCWNSELLAAMNSNLSSAWNQLDKDVEGDLPSWGSEMQSRLEDVIKTSEENQAPTAFIRNMQARQRNIQHLIDDETEFFLRKFRTIKSDATGPHLNSYIMAEMRPVYRRCAQDGGTGTFARCKGWMRDKITSGTIFPAIHKATLAEMKKSSADTATNLKSQLSVLCDGIDKDLKNMKRPIKSVFEEDPELKRAMGELLKRAEVDLTEIEKMGEDARKEAEKRGYIRGEKQT